jgi:hypothetical protein
MLKQYGVTLLKLLKIKKQYKYIVSTNMFDFNIID